jgi:tRNA-Thr(GGU) m(6)t(6)A37 methyltransferase TsaA
VSPSYSFSPIGFVRSPFTERREAPRQPSVAAARDVEATIELSPGRDLERALEGMDGWEYAWVLFVFHRNVEEGRGVRTKVLPPRSETKHGVLATRSPHRPNPIGLSAVRIVGVQGLTVRIKNVDLLDGTPVLDLKPYVAYADAYPNARAGWLEAHDPLPVWEVVFAEPAEAQLAWLRDRGVDLREPIQKALSLGPEPHPYRRIRPHGTGMRLALKEWRVDFEVEGRRIVVRSLATGYRARDLAEKAALEVHREMVRVWG